MQGASRMSVNVDLKTNQTETSKAKI